MESAQPAHGSHRLFRQPHLERKSVTRLPSIARRRFGRRRRKASGPAGCAPVRGHPSARPSVRPCMIRPLRVRVAQHQQAIPHGRGIPGHCPASFAAGPDVVRMTDATHGELRLLACPAGKGSRRAHPAPGCSPWRLRPAPAALRLPSRTVAARPACGAYRTARLKRRSRSRRRGQPRRARAGCFRAPRSSGLRAAAVTGFTLCVPKFALIDESRAAPLSVRAAPAGPRGRTVLPDQRSSPSRRRMRAPGA